jgi:4-alpha-glucanotransferase
MVNTAPVQGNYYAQSRINNNKNVSFGRKLREEEKPEYKALVQDALKQLNKDNVGIIVQGPSFPTESNADTGIGSPYTKSAVHFMNFLDELGFNCLQLGPAGKTKKSDASPYTSTIFSDNPMFVDLKALSSKEWGQILSKESFNTIVQQNDKRNSGKVNYEYAYEQYDKGLREAWANFQNPAKLSKTDQKIIAQKQIAFDQFKEENKFWLESDALYEALTKIYNNDYWPNWEGNKAQTDKNLVRMLLSDDPKTKAKAEQRKAEIEKHPEVDFFKFCQFVINDQKNKTKSESPINTIADIQVTYSDRDWWAYQNLFLDDHWLGVPPDFFSKTGQAWGFPAINPDKLFAKDENGKIIHENGKPVLGEAGQLIKSRFDKVFKENPGGVRIDHILGLIDPWVYPKSSETAMAQDGGKRLFSSPELDGKFKEWAKISETDIDKSINPETEEKVKSEAIDKAAIDRYSEIIDIVIQSAKDNNVPLANIICEDLGTLTTPAASVLNERGLSGLRVTEFVNPDDDKHIYRAKNVEPRHWVVPGTHDNDTLLSWAEELFKPLSSHIKALRNDLNGQSPRFDVQEISAEIAKAKLAEAFASPAKNVQFMFMDVFGIKDRYNNPGARTPDEQADCWRLRVPNNYEDYYHKQLQTGKGLNLPEVLEIALKSKDGQFAKNNKELINNLHKYSEILKKPEHKELNNTNKLNQTI